MLIILWGNAAIKATREMEEVDGDAMEWIKFPLPLKLLTLLVSPILFMIYERHILETKIKDKKS